mgnify:FL=1
MGLWSKVKNVVVPSNRDEAPQKATFATREDTVYAPVSGVLVSIQEVHDEIISNGLFGQGYGVLPVGIECVYAPCDARISATTVTNHSIGLTTDEGVEILIHVGVGTVDMNGKDFTRYVHANDSVKAGTPLISFDSAAIEEAGYENVVVITIVNADQFSRIDLIGESGTLIGGRPLVKVGDPLLLVKH